MAKDPAFLFYSSDFLTGVMTLGFEDRGKFITILALMHQQGRMDEETISLLVGSFSVKLKNKFKIDSNGLYYNERLEIESEKRNNFTQSRRNNGIKGGRPKENDKPKRNLSVNHKDNLMEDENVNVIKDIIEYLNNKVSKNFKITESNSRPIKARINEGYTIDDFKKVIDIKKADWFLDPKMSEFLRPITLFGTKFESYLNSKPKQAVRTTPSGSILPPNLV